VKPAPFAYFVPDTLDEVLAILADHADDAKALAGGQSLVPAMNFRLAQPAALVDLNRVVELSTISETDRGLRLGAMVRHQTLETSAVVARRAPLIRDTMPWVAHPPIRTRGTIGGSLAHADPAAELPAVCLALDATLELRTAGRTRETGAGDFFVGLYTTALEPGELVTAVLVPPLPPRSGWAIDEVARRHGDYALAGVAAVVTLDDEGRCAGVRIGLLSVHDRPVLATHAMAALERESPSAEAIRSAADAAATRDAEPSSDIHASAAYRRHLVRVLTGRVLARAIGRARATAED
jgi:carbon-monoxide dehydrogenase medium subunit